MTCPVPARRRCQQAARALDREPTVVVTDVLEPDDALTTHWEVDCIVDVDDGLIPPAVAATLAEHELALRPGGPRGAYFQVVGVAQ
jgi:hypothetical protein